MTNPRFIPCRVPWCRDDQHVPRDGSIHHGASVTVFSRGGASAYVDLAWAERPGERSIDPHVAMYIANDVTGACGWRLDLTAGEARALARVLTHLQPFAADILQFSQALTKAAGTLARYPVDDPPAAESTIQVVTSPPTAKAAEAIQREIDSLEREDWHSDDRSRRAMVIGLKNALGMVKDAEHLDQQRGIEDDS